MKRKKSSKKAPQFISKHNTIIAAIALLLAVGIIFQLLYDRHMSLTRSALPGSPTIANLISAAENNLQAPAPVDAKTGQVYFPDVKLMLPPPGQNLSLRQVEYSTVGTGSSLDLQVTTGEILRESEAKLLEGAQNSPNDASKQIRAIFNQVPKLQACARGVQLFYVGQTNNNALKLQFTKKLANGKTLYAYSEPKCDSVALPKLTNYIKKIQSY